MESGTSSTSESSSNMTAVLHERNYMRLLIGQIIAGFGDRINQTAILSYIIHVKGNVGKYSADIMFWAALPAIILGWFALALIDRWDRRRTMMVSDGSRAVCALLFPLLLLWIGHHYVIYALVFVMGAFAGLFSPCRLSIIPNLLPEKHLMAGNALSSQAGTVATIIAMPVSGWIVSYCGRDASFMINGLTYFISALFIWKLPKASGLVRRNHMEARPSPWQDFKDGMSYITGHGRVLYYVIFFGLLQLLAGLFFVCFFEFSVNILGLKELGATQLFGAMGVGMAAGAIWISCNSRWGEKYGWPMAMLALTGLGMLLLSQINRPWPAAGVLFVIGLFSVMVMVPLDTYLQKHVQDAFRGRVFVARGILGGAAFLTSLQFSKAIVHHLQPLATLKWMGGTAVGIGVVSLLLTRYFFKNERN